MLNVSHASESALSDASWKLVQIMSMDDTVDTPRIRTKYTLTLNADGEAVMHADCNLQRRSWRSEGQNQIRFGPVATSPAECAPGSISGRYLTQFEWVRSYVIEDGHLFLATMADGAIIEFEPLFGPPNPLK